MSKPRLSALAQLVRCLIRDGMTTTDALVEETGYSRRAIFAARAELQKVQPAAVQPSAPVQPAAQTSAAECTNQCSPLHSGPRAPARIETPSGLVIPKGLSEDPPFPPGERVALVSGKIRICAELRSFWLDQFGGDAQRLDLALIQAAGYVQTSNHARPLEAQVGAQLARIAGDKREKDQRYRETAARNALDKPTAARPAFRISAETVRYAKPAPEVGHA
jgi:hypothetical protein